jgi:hypothetical protein
MCFTLALFFATQLNIRISMRIGNAGREPESFTDIAGKLPAPGVIVTRLTWPQAVARRHTIDGHPHSGTLTGMARNLRLGWHLQ